MTFEFYTHGYINNAISDEKNGFAQDLIVEASDASGSKILTRAGSFLCCSGRVGSDIFGLGLENFPQKSQILPIG